MSRSPLLRTGIIQPSIWRKSNPFRKVLVISMKSVFLFLVLSCASAQAQCVVPSACTPAATCETARVHVFRTPIRTAIATVRDKHLERVAARRESRMLAVAFTPRACTPSTPMCAPPPSACAPPTYQATPMIPAPPACSPVRPSMLVPPAPQPTSSLIEVPGAHDAMDELNSQRARRGLRPFIKDPGLTLAAEKAVAYRAANHVRLHTRNDFSFVPQGSRASVAGAGYGTSNQFLTCFCDSSNYQYAGAAYAYDDSGNRLMHLYAR